MTTPKTPIALGKMSRYEGRFERTFYKALKELQRLAASVPQCPILGMGLFRRVRFPPGSDPPDSPPPAPVAPAEAAEIELPVPVDVGDTA